MLRDIAKSFGGTRALEGVSLTVGRGAIHALVGENGAGKSTLGKIIAGAIAPDRGQLMLDGEPVRFRSPRDAISRGVILIAQELAILPSLTVAQNVYLGVEPRQAGFQKRRELRRKYNELTAGVGFDLDGDASAGSLRTADQQKVEILRALCRNAKVIVMDEPTAALSRPDAEALYKVIRQLARGGTTVVLVSHFLNEVLGLADEVTILRDGHLVRTVPAAGQTEESLMAAMLGRPLDKTFPPKRPTADAPAVLSVRDLVAPGVNGVSFDLRAGEILGLAGLVGVLMIPESRKEQGLLPGRPVRENVSLSTLEAVSAAGVVRRGPERRAVRDALARVDARGALSAPVSSLSGGNQQKLLFARSLLRDAKVLIADEPTRGVDVGAKRAIYELLATLTAGGLGVLLISSDIEEVLGLAHRVLVMRGGKITAELTGEDVTEAAILGAAFGAEAPREEAFGAEAPQGEKPRAEDAPVPRFPSPPAAKEVRE